MSDISEKKNIQTKAKSTGLQPTAKPSYAF